MGTRLALREEGRGQKTRAARKAPARRPSRFAGPTLHPYGVSCAADCPVESGTYAAQDVQGTRQDRLPDLGEVIAGKYRIERLIGRGAMGAVFAARNTVLGTPVALKMLLASSSGTEDARARFFNEARAAASLESEHVARVHDLGELDGGAFMALELLEGSDLEQMVAQRGPLPAHEAVDWILQGLEGVAEAHALGIVHRDLKPSNLFVANRRDGTRIVKVLDFGIAKRTIPGPGSGNLTATSVILGSPAYMAPEQLRSARCVDARTDVWAIGVVLYELLTGRLPFCAGDFAELVVAVFESVPAPVGAWRIDVPAGLDAVVMRCLSREPAGRFPDVAALAEALAPFAAAGAQSSVERIRHVLRTPAPRGTHSPAAPPAAPPRGVGLRAAIAAAAIGILAAAGAGLLGTAGCGHALGP